MSSTTSRLEKEGFLSQLPPKANIDDFEEVNKRKIWQKTKNVQEEKRANRQRGFGKFYKQLDFFSAKFELIFHFSYCIIFSFLHLIT